MRKVQESELSINILSKKVLLFLLKLTWRIYMDPATKKIVKEVLKFVGKVLVTGILYGLAARVWRW